GREEGRCADDRGDPAHGALSICRSRSAVDTPFGAPLGLVRPVTPDRVGRRSASCRLRTTLSPETSFLQGFPAAVPTGHWAPRAADATSPPTPHTKEER